MRKLLFINVAIIALLVTACNTQNKDCSNKAEIEENKANNNHLIMATAWYQNSAELDACYYQAFYLAELALKENIKNDNSEKPNAIVLDIDETLLDNSPFQVEMILTGKPYTKEFWKEWTDLAKAEALPGAIDFLNKAKAMGIEIFYISNRRTNEIDATIKNMQALNFPETRADHFLLKEDTSDKEARRAIVKANYDIVLLVGDNLGDYSNFVHDRSINYGKETLAANKHIFGKQFIVLPNPMYGEWVKPLKNKTQEKDYSKFIEKLPTVLTGFNKN